MDILEKFYSVLEFGADPEIVDEIVDEIERLRGEIKAAAFCDARCSWVEHHPSCVFSERDALRAELDAARRTAEYWKAEHLAGNAELDALKSHEPVAWAVMGWAVTQSESEAMRWEHRGMKVTPLYAAPKPGEEK